MLLHAQDPVQNPEAVDTAAVAATLPHGNVKVKAVLGGMNVVDAENGSTTVIATVGVEAWLDIADGMYSHAE